MDMVGLHGLSLDTNKLACFARRPKNINQLLGIFGERPSFCVAKLATFEKTSRSIFMTLS